MSLPVKPGKPTPEEKATLESAAIQGWIAIGVRTEWAGLLGKPADSSWKELLDATRDLTRRHIRNQED